LFTGGEENREPDYREKGSDLQGKSVWGGGGGSQIGKVNCKGLPTCLAILS